MCTSSSKTVKPDNIYKMCLRMQEHTINILACSTLKNVNLSYTAQKLYKHDIKIFGL